MCTFFRALQKMHLSNWVLFTFVILSVIGLILDLWINKQNKRGLLMLRAISLSNPFKMQKSPWIFLKWIKKWKQKKNMPYIFFLVPHFAWCLSVCVFILCLRWALHQHTSHSLSHYLALCVCVSLLWRITCRVVGGAHFQLLATYGLLLQQNGRSVEMRTPLSFFSLLDLPQQVRILNLIGHLDLYIQPIIV